VDCHRRQVTPAHGSVTFEGAEYFCAQIFLERPRARATPLLSKYHEQLAGSCIEKYCKLGSTALSQISDKVTRSELLNPILSRRDNLWPFVSSFTNLRSIEVIKIRIYTMSISTVSSHTWVCSLGLRSLGFCPRCEADSVSNGCSGYSGQRGGVGV
jgi:hypothetical protein